MSIDALASVIIPPPLPHEVPLDAYWWEIIEYSLGYILPDDYKEYIRRYGTGRLGYTLDIWNPFASNPHCNLCVQSMWNLKVILAREDEYPAIKSIFGRSLPFGDTAAGDVLCWLRPENPTASPIGILRVRSDDYEVHNTPLSEFLFQLATGTLNSFLTPLFKPEIGFVAGAY